MVILTAGAQLAETVIIRGFLYAAETTISLTWNGVKWAYSYITSSEADISEDTDSAIQEKERDKMQQEIKDLRYEIIQIKKKMKSD